MRAAFHVLWNALIPWRRRRRYYFLRVVSRVVRLLQESPAKPIAETVLARSCGLTLTEFTDMLAGRAVPPALIETVGRVAYRLPAPTWWTVYGPITAGALGVAAAIGLHLLRII